MRQREQAQGANRIEEATKANRKEGEGARFSVARQRATALTVNGSSKTDQYIERGIRSKIVLASSRKFLWYAKEAPPITAKTEKEKREREEEEEERKKERRKRKGIHPVSLKPKEQKVLAERLSSLVLFCFVFLTQLAYRHMTLLRES